MIDVNRIEKLLVEIGMVEENEYLEKYLDLICENMINFKCKENELHHCVPKCYKTINEDWNLVYLSIADHCLAHYYLAMCSKGKWKYKNANAWCWIMKTRKVKLEELTYKQVMSICKEYEYLQKIERKQRAINIKNRSPEKIKKASLKAQKTRKIKRRGRTYINAYNDVKQILIPKDERKLYIEKGYKIGWKKKEKYLYKGQLYTIAHLSFVNNIPHELLRCRIRANNYSNIITDEMLSPKEENDTYTYKGVTKTKREWAKELGLDTNVFYKRCKSNKTPDEIMKPIHKVKKYLYKGEYFSRKELCEKYNLYESTFINRLRKGWTIEQIIETPRKEFKHSIEYKGKTYTYKEFANKCNITYSCLLCRMYEGWSLEEIANTPLRKW